MQKTYCPECGSPNEYVSAKPNFCGSCGKSLSFANNKFAQTFKSVAGKTKPIEIRDSEDHDYKHLDVENDDFTYDGGVEIEESPRTSITFDSLSKQKKTNSYRETTAQQLTKEQFLESFKASAGPSKPIEINEE